MSLALTKVRPLDGPETGLPERLGKFLRERHPLQPVKQVQSALALLGEHVAGDTIKNWVAGEKWPSWPSHLDALMRAYGQDLADAVFSPSLLVAEQLEEQRIARLEAEAAARRARLDHARQHLKGFARGQI